jgi:transglycosylase-like protein with SLT domain
MNVTGVIAIVLKAHAYILRLTNARIRHLVVSEWAARGVLRYWRLRRQGQQLVDRLKLRRRELSITLAGHALVLGLGFVLVVPVMTVRPTITPTVAAHYAGYVLSTTPVRPRTVPVREALKASALEERPAPEVIVPAAPAAPAPRPAAPAFVPPPPGSGGDGLAAIYAVFGSSPGLSWALRVANCESHYNPLAVNRSSGASGLFQFMPSTWNANFPGQNIWDPYAQARGALVFYNAGRQSAWTCK